MAIEAEALRDALRLALKFVDRAGGEGLGFVADGDHPETDAADVCVAVAEALGIEFAGSDYMALIGDGPLPDLIHRSALAEDTARAAEIRSVLDEAKSGLWAWSGGEYGACRDTIAKIDRLLSALPLDKEAADANR